jgi:hypothetical protein
MGPGQPGGTGRPSRVHGGESSCRIGDLPVSAWDPCPVTPVAINAHARGRADDDIVSIDELVPIAVLEPRTAGSARWRVATSRRMVWPASLLTLTMVTVGTGALLHYGSDPAVHPDRRTHETAVSVPSSGARPRARGETSRAVRGRHRNRVPHRRYMTLGRRGTHVRPQPLSAAPIRLTSRRPSSAPAHMLRGQTAQGRPSCEFEPSCDATGASP